MGRPLHLKNFIKNINHFFESFDKQIIALRPILAFLVEWFLEHVVGMDRQFIPYVKNKKSTSGTIKRCFSSPSNAGEYPEAYSDQPAIVRAFDFTSCNFLKVWRHSYRFKGHVNSMGPEDSLVYNPMIQLPIILNHPPFLGLGPVIAIFFLDPAQKIYSSR